MQRRSFLGWMFAAPVAAKAVAVLPVAPVVAPPVTLPETIAPEISKVENEIEIYGKLYDTLVPMCRIPTEHATLPANAFAGRWFTVRTVGLVPKISVMAGDRTPRYVRIIDSSSPRATLWRLMVVTESVRTYFPVDRMANHDIVFRVVNLDNPA